jgi:hypothetical protein
MKGGREEAWATDFNFSLPLSFSGLPLGLRARSVRCMASGSLEITEDSLTHILAQLTLFLLITESSTSRKLTL